jgi:hypothetical protein
MKKLSIWLVVGIVFGLIGLCLSLASLGIEHYVHLQEQNQESVIQYSLQERSQSEYDYERVIVNTCGQISIFIGFCIIYTVIVIRLKRSGQW